MVAAPNKTDDAARTDSGTRIVVGLDTSLIAREALSLAARLAASVDARLKGVFVEDENLLSLADLPFAREVSFSGEVRALDPERMLRAMRAQAESARRTLARIAAEAHVDWSFDVRRGRPLPSLAARAGREDTLVIRSPGMGAREVGRTVRAATREARADVLLVARGAGLKTALAVPAPAAQGGIYTSPPGRPVASVDEGTSPGEACSAFAETLAARIGAPFVRLAAKGRAPADLAAAARQGGVGILVVNADWLGDDDDAARLSAAAGCPVLLLGKERGALEGSVNKRPEGRGRRLNMSMRKILVPLAGRPDDDEVLSTALSVARAFKAQLVGLFARPDPSEALPYLGDGVSGQVIEDLMQAAREGADEACARVRAALEKTASAAGVAVAKEGGKAEMPSARFLDVTGRRDEIIAKHSRLSDLIVFGESPTGIAGGTALEAAMMSADRPVLIAPKKAWDPVGGTVCIGWDDSPEASSAVMMAIPFLEKAKKVTILCIGGKELDPGPGSTLADYLALHGVTTDVHLVDGQGKADGEVLLEQAEAAKADLLVMGGYGHSRLREFLMGGTTQHVRSHATIPVLMAH